MKPTNIYDFTIPANGAYRLLVSGDYFKVLSASGAVNVRADWGAIRGLTGGQGMESSPFSYLLFEDTTGGANTLRVLVGDEKFIDGLSGTMSIGQNIVARAPFTNTQTNVTNASALLSAANAARSYLLVQNKHATANIFLSFGAAATLGNGIRIAPGGSYETGFVVPTNAVYAIADVALNTEVVVVGG